MSATEKELKDRLNDFQYKILAEPSIGDEEVLTSFNRDFPKCKYLLPVIASYRFLVQLQKSKMSGSPSRDAESNELRGSHRKLTISHSASILTGQTVNFELGSVTRDTYHAALESLYTSQKQFIFDKIVMGSQEGFSGKYDPCLDTLGVIYHKTSALLPRTPSPTADKEKDNSPIRILARNLSEIFSSPRKKSPSPPPHEEKIPEINKETFLELSEKYNGLLQEFGIGAKSPRESSTNPWVSSTPSLKKTT